MDLACVKMGLAILHCRLDPFWWDGGRLVRGGREITMGNHLA